MRRNLGPDSPVFGPPSLSNLQETFFGTRRSVPRKGSFLRATCKDSCVEMDSSCRVKRIILFADRANCAAKSAKSFSRGLTSQTKPRVSPFNEVVSQIRRAFQ
jgi:hypothetical protein